MDKNLNRPIDKFHKIWRNDIKRGADTKRLRGINDRQYWAGCKISESFLKCSSYRKDAGAVKIPAGINKLPRGNVVAESIAMNITDHKKIFDRLALWAQKVITHICFEEKTLKSLEESQTPVWPKGSGIIMLRSALDELEAIYIKLNKKPS